MGVAIIRYKIQQTDTNTAKASGGAISFYNSKTIHVFQGLQAWNIYCSWKF